MLEQLLITKNKRFQKKRKEDISAQISKFIVLQNMSGIMYLMLHKKYLKNCCFSVWPFSFMTLCLYLN